MLCREREPARHGLIRFRLNKLDLARILFLRGVTVLHLGFYARQRLCGRDGFGMLFAEHFASGAETCAKEREGTFAITGLEKNGGKIVHCGQRVRVFVAEGVSRGFEDLSGEP